MKSGDIVAVRDASWSVSIYIANGLCEYPDGSDLEGRKFRVLSTCGRYPTNDLGDCTMCRNDIMLIDTKDPIVVLFSRMRFCSVVTPLPSTPTTAVEFQIPPGATAVKVSFEH